MQPDHVNSEDHTPTNDAAESSSEFRICDEKSANWLVRKVVEARAYRKRVRRWAEREIRQAAEDEKRLLFRYGTQLQAWASDEIRKLRGRRKSVGLPGGRVGYRTAGPKLVIEDVVAVVRWAKTACPEAIILEQRLDKATLNAHLLNSGEIPDHGAHLEPEREQFFIK